MREVEWPLMARTQRQWEKERERELERKSMRAPEEETNSDDKLKGPWEPTWIRCGVGGAPVEESRGRRRRKTQINENQFDQVKNGKKETK